MYSSPRRIAYAAIPCIGPDSKSLLRGARRGTARLRAGFLFAAAFFLLGAVLATGFFLATRFVLTALFLAVFFVATFFLVAFFLLIFFFLAAGFFRETLFLPAAFLAAGFFLALTFFFDDFFADGFFLLTVRFLPADCFRLTDLLDAAFFLAAPPVVRFLRTVFFAGILQFLPDRKARHYTPVISTWKGIYGVFKALFGRRIPAPAASSCQTLSRAYRRDHFSLFSQRDRGLFELLFGAGVGAGGGCHSGSQLQMSFAGDDRFICRITLH